MKKEEVVIIVRGGKTLNSEPRFVRKLVETILKPFKIVRGIPKNYLTMWKTGLSKKGRDVVIFGWDGEVTLFSRYLAKKKLERLLNKYKNNKQLKLIGISLGGEVILETIKNLHTNFIKKIILVGSVNTKDNINENKIDIINIYSLDDKFLSLCDKLLHPFSSSFKLNGKNIENISIRGMDHYDFCMNKKIKYGKYKGKTVLSLLNNFL